MAVQQAAGGRRAHGWREEACGLRTVCSDDELGGSSDAEGRDEEAHVASWGGALVIADGNCDVVVAAAKVATVVDVGCRRGGSGARTNARSSRRVEATVAELGDGRGAWRLLVGARRRSSCEEDETRAGVLASLSVARQAACAVGRCRGGGASGLLRVVTLRRRWQRPVGGDGRGGRS